ncbi:MAG: T9SS type A sorting domain-containing protein [Ignavibacteriales bacterium]|nr:T9SS type A sorting domain-containing protein [Ignavibacteriales bacterium]
MKRTVMLLAILALTLANASWARVPDSIVVNVLVISLDPIIEYRGGQRLTDLKGYNDYETLSAGYKADMEAATDGGVIINFVGFEVWDLWPVKADGFYYTDSSYVENREHGDQTGDYSGMHSPDGVNYNQLIDTLGLIPRINSGEVDEVWVFGGGWFGFWESAMAGPGAFYINGGPISGVNVDRAFVILGLNWERGVAEMLHSNCHRTESTMQRIYDGWNLSSPVTNWDFFSANEHQSGGEAGVGTCHFPANGQSHYDYANTRTVQSTAADWLNWPDLTGAKTGVSRNNWGGPDYHRNYMKWFYAHFPRAAGVNADGKWNNWYQYVYNFNYFDSDGNPLFSLALDAQPPDTLNADSTYTVEWSASSIDDVEITYSTDGGVSWIVVEDSIPAATGSYAWNVEADWTMTECTLRVSAIDKTPATVYSESFTIYQDDPVPVELTAFEASVSDDGVTLFWRAASETNNRGYAVERAEAGERFERIGFVEGAGVSNKPTAYEFVDRDAPQGVLRYRLKQIDLDGSFSVSREIEVSIAAPTAYELRQNYPNPFNPTTTISYSVPVAGDVSLVVFNSLGETVATPANGYHVEGSYEATFDASGLPSGVYYYRLTAGEFSQTNKMVLMK